MTYKSLLSCTCNTRELGGIRTSDGGLTKSGVFWRSDVPVAPTAEDAEKLRTAHITTIIDMRTSEEVQRHKNALSDVVLSPFSVQTSPSSV